jgi:hypothetical protein
MSNVDGINIRRPDELSHRARATVWNAYGDRVWSTLIAVISFLRCLPLFFSARPKTPLRVLCVIAFDTLHMLRHSKPLPATKRRMLAALLDFGACTNAMFDNKDYCRKETQLTRQILDEAGLHSLVEEFLRRLGELERKRPSPLEEDWQFHRVRSYREGVVRLWLGMVATTAIGNHSIDEGIRATYCDSDLKILFRIVMQCQIIDDVLDYSKDTSAGLPSFLTAAESLPDAIKRTHHASLGYADNRDLPRSDDVFPMRIALFFVSTCARLTIQLGRWRFAAFKSATPATAGASHILRTGSLAHSRPCTYSKKGVTKPLF